MALQSWPTKTEWCVICQSRFWGSTAMFRPFPDLLRRLSVFSQQRWLLPSWSLLSMSLPSRIGVTQYRRTMDISIQMGTWNGSTVYLILLWSTLLPFLSTQFPNLSTRRLLLSSSGPDIVPTHSRSSTTSVLEWRLQWGFLMWFQIHYFRHFWGHSIRLYRVWGGVGSAEEE